MAAAGILALFAVLTWQQSRTYRDEESLLRATITRNPGSAMAQDNLGSLLMGKGRLVEAMACFRQAVWAQPGDVAAENNLGVVLARLGRFPEAALHYQAALRLAPGYPQADYNLGLALHDGGDNEAAIVHLRNAVQLRPDSSAAWNALGLCLSASNRIREAIPCFEQARRLRPEDPDPLESLARAFPAEGDMRNAIACFLPSAPARTLGTPPCAPAWARRPAAGGTKRTRRSPRVQGGAARTAGLRRGSPSISPSPCSRADGGKEAFAEHSAGLQRTWRRPIRGTPSESSVPRAEQHGPSVVVQYFGGLYLGSSNCWRKASAREKSINAVDPGRARPQALVFLVGTASIGHAIPKGNNALFGATAQGMPIPAGSVLRMGFPPEIQPVRVHHPDHDGFTGRHPRLDSRKFGPEDAGEDGLVVLEVFRRDRSKGERRAMDRDLPDPRHGRRQESDHHRSAQNRGQVAGPSAATELVDSAKQAQGGRERGMAIRKGQA